MVLFFLITKQFAAITLLAGKNVFLRYVHQVQRHLSLVGRLKHG